MLYGLDLSLRTEKGHPSTDRRVRCLTTAGDERILAHCFKQAYVIEFNTTVWSCMSPIWGT